MVSYLMEMDTNSSNLSSLWDLIHKRNDIILRSDSNLTAIGLYVDQLEERLSSFVVARRETAIKE